MAKLVPFRGLRYNKNKISNLAAVATPPYDVIDEAAQARYYAEHPANIIRLELGLTFPQDSTDNNRHSRAQQYLTKWLEEETLLPEAKPSFYLYQQTFKYRDQSLTRNGLICGMKVEDYAKGTILPHEETLSKPKADRLKLMMATQANFSSIFGLYSDEVREIDHLLLDFAAQYPPDIDIIDEADEVHKIWVISDQVIIDKIISIMADKKIYIADGHHRYETALEYSKIMKNQGINDYDYVMATLVNLYDEGLVVFPTYRVVGNLQGFKLGQFLEQLKILFQVERYGSKNNWEDFLQQLEKKSSHSHIFGMYTGKDLYFLELKDEKQAFSLLPEDKSPAWRNLDVALLDNLILSQILNIGESERRNQDNLAYTRDPAWLIDQVDQKQYQLGFFLNATGVQEIVAVANEKEKMPQKSTYFYPKLLTGLIINHLKTS